MGKMPSWVRMGGMAALLAAWLLGCGGSPSVAPVPQNQGVAPVDPARSGTLTVHLVQDGLPGAFSHLNLVLDALEVRVAGSWRPVPLNPSGRALDLLAATSAAPLLLAAQVPWPAGSNDAMRFSLGAGSTVQLAAEDPDSFHPLAVPPQFISTMGLPGSFSVPVLVDTDLWISFSVTHVAAPNPDDDDDYLFFPGPVRGYDKAATGSIGGGVTDRASSGPLHGAVVTAQLRAGTGQPGADIAFRTVQSDASGHYTLDLLPKGYTWCVVNQPVLETDTYFAQASPGFALGGAPYDQYETSLALAPVAVAGSVSGTVASGLGIGLEDTVDLRQEIAVAGVPCDFVLQSAPVVPDSEGGFSFSFPSVPPGIYSLVLNDYSQSLSLGLVDQSDPTARFAVTAGGRTVVTF